MKHFLLSFLLIASLSSLSSCKKNKNEGRKADELYIDAKINGQDWNSTSVNNNIATAGDGSRIQIYFGTNQTGTFSFFTHPVTGTQVSLPGIEIMNMRLGAYDSRFTVKWSTVLETNISKFEIQRSPNGTDWTTLGSVHAAGNSSQQVDYSFADEEASHFYSDAGRYYRIKVIKTDASYIYTTTFFTLGILPSPAIITYIKNNKAYYSLDNNQNQITITEVKPGGNRKGTFSFTYKDAGGNNVLVTGSFHLKQ